MHKLSPQHENRIFNFFVEFIYTYISGFLRGQSVREEVVADRMSCTETRSAVLPEGQLNVQDRDPIITVTPMRNLDVLLTVHLSTILVTDKPNAQILV